jgi:hypothetical protein
MERDAQPKLRGIDGRSSPARRASSTPQRHRACLWSARLPAKVTAPSSGQEGYAIMLRPHSRVAVAALVALTTACFDPGSGPEIEGTTGDEPTGGSEPTGASMSSATSPTDPSDPTTAGPSSTSEPATSTTETDPSDPTTAGTDPGESTGEGSTTGGDAPVTIYQIQQGEIEVDSAVLVEDAICTAVASNGFFMQEPEGGEWSGIWVFTGMGAALPALGDVVTVTGVYEEFFELTEINTMAGSVTVTESPGEGNVPAPETIALTDVGESWESVFVRVTGNSLRVSELHPMPAVHEFLVTDGVGMVWIDDLMYDATTGDFPGFGLFASFTDIQGPLNFAFMEFRVAPRMMSDLSGYTPP